MSVSLSFSLLLSHIDSHSLTCAYDTTVHPNVLPTLEEFVRNAEKCDVGVQLYYTVGQISNHAPELFAFAGMNGEILLRDSADKPPSPGKKESHHLLHDSKYSTKFQLNTHTYIHRTCKHHV